MGLTGNARGERPILPGRSSLGHLRELQLLASTRRIVGEPELIQLGSANPTPLGCRLPLQRCQLAGLGQDIAQYRRHQ